MSERTNVVFASVGTIAVAAVSAWWMISIGGWGPAVYSVVLAGVVVWRLLVAERRRIGDVFDERSAQRLPDVWS